VGIRPIVTTPADPLSGFSSLLPLKRVAGRKAMQCKGPSLLLTVTL